MDTLNVATQCARDEIFSSKFFIVAAVIFIAGAIGFWVIGKSELAKSFTTPMLVCGTLLLVIGVGLVYNNQTRVKNFTETYNKDKIEFIKLEIERTEKTIIQTEKTIFRWIPIIIIIAALLIIFIDKPAWRAASISIIAMMIVLLFVDSNSHSRIKAYNEILKEKIK